MIKFCSVCGSMMNNDLCSNKKCTLHKTAAGSEPKPAAKKASNNSTVKAAKAKSDYDKARRNSKCITYRIEDLEKEKENN